MRKLIEAKREKLMEKIEDWRWKRFQKASHERLPDDGLRRRPATLPIDALTLPTTHIIRAPFHYVERVIIDFRYATNTESFVLFGVDAALTDGILIKYNGQTLFDMKATADLGKFSYDVRDLEDSAATKFHTVHSRYSFRKFTDNMGLRVRDFEKLELVIPKDLRPGGVGSNNTSLTFTFEGWYQ